MKKHFRYLTFLPLLLIMILGTALTSISQPAAANSQIEASCLLSCQQEHSACFIAAGGKNSAENHCLARYRHCIAQCGKH
jgi:hypothetical protein